ncbi:MAG: hypothetical protein ACI4SM_05895 [Candidatus Gastranaerophilaceae bacterium]
MPALKSKFNDIESSSRRVKSSSRKARRIVFEDLTMSEYIKREAVSPTDEMLEELCAIFS